MEGIDYNALNNEQKEFVHKYRTIQDKLKVLQESMDLIQEDTKMLINELTELRKKETKLFNNG